MTHFLKTLTALAALAAMSNASALTFVTSGSANTLLPVAAIDITANSNPVSTNSFISNVNLAQFDGSLGVLTGVSSDLSVNYRLSQLSLTTTGTTRLAANWSVGGAAVVDSTLATRNSGGNTSGTASLNLNSGFAALGTFIGPGSLTSSVSYTASANKASGLGGVTATGSNLSANHSLTYTYLEHANASLDVGSDLNSAGVLATSGGTAFAVYALGGINTTLLDGVSISCTGDCAAFNLSMPLVSDLAAGMKQTGTASLQAAAPGSYAAQYTLTFTDDSAVGVGQQTNSLTLDVNGTVAAVPEPHGVLLAISVLGFGALLRRRPQG